MLFCQGHWRRYAVPFGNFFTLFSPRFRNWVFFLCVNGKPRMFFCTNRLSYGCYNCVCVFLSFFCSQNDITKLQLNKKQDLVASEPLVTLCQQHTLSNFMRKSPFCMRPFFSTLNSETIANCPFFVHVLFMCWCSVRIVHCKCVCVYSECFTTLIPLKFYVVL